jgi:hypothetical protein
MVYPDYEPAADKVDAVMLRAALRSLATKAGSTDGAMDALLGMLKE